jgi:NAD(P)H-nitrite reductase large subunit
MNYLIIGNSAAAIGCVEGIRRQDADGGITILTDEAHHTYSRPLISYLLAGKTDRQRMKYRRGGFYEENGCTLVYARAVGVDPQRKEVRTADGGVYPYGKLLIAAGSRPFAPDIDGLDGVERRFAFLTLDDALALERAIAGTSRVLVVGAGLIGLKCAEGISGRVGGVTVVDMADRPLSSILDGASGEIMRGHIEKQGVCLRLGESVARFRGNTAHLAGGGRLEFDILVMAVGVKPNTALFPGEVGHGIPVDERCRTGIPDIYAAGDCTESMDVATGTRRVLALLPNAYMQGECAGENMAGGCAVFDKAMPMNAIGFFGLHIVTAGSYDGSCEVVGSRGTEYKMLCTKDGRLRGYIIMGNVERAGIYTALIRNKTPLEGIDFELIREKPQLMAFSRTERKKQLGGVV